MEIKYNKEEAEKIVKESFSIAECLRKMGYGDKPGNYKTFYRYKELYNLDTSHFTGQGYMKGKKAHTYKGVEHYTQSKGLGVKGGVLLKKLIDEGYKERKCENCKRSEWEGKPIPLQIHHIDGNHYNNDINNLQVLCHNCHALTDNFCAKNRKKKKEVIEKKTKHKTNKPTKDELKQLLKENSFVAVGKMFSVTDNAVRKWCISYNLPIHKKEYKDL